MQSRFEAKTRAERFFEHVVWNAAAGAVLAVMVLILLGGLRWLDQIAPQGATEVVPATPTQIARPLDDPSDRPTGVIAVNRPSG